LLISSFLAFTLVGIVVTNLPESKLKAEVGKVTQPYLNAVGLDQNWGVFAPDPRKQVLRVRARVTYADGRSATWRLPSGDPVIGSFWAFRWRKLVEYVTSTDYTQLWRPFAIYIARHEERRGHAPTRVTLLRGTRDILPPGGPASFGPWQEAPYYDLDVAALRASERAG
jgi:hypothetical protein